MDQGRQRKKHIVKKQAMFKVVPKDDQNRVVQAQASIRPKVDQQWTKIGLNAKQK